MLAIYYMSLLRHYGKSFMFALKSSREGIIVLENGLGMLWLLLKVTSPDTAIMTSIRTLALALTA